VKLINDEYNDCWVWVEDHDENIELSPHFDYEEDATQWRDRMRKELDDSATKNNQKEPNGVWPWHPL
jgi:hypothetical protein